LSAQDSSRLIPAIGGLLAGLAVAAGAFGAHMLKSILDPPMLTVYDTATRYQFYHALGMVLVGLSMRICGDRKLATAAWLFAAGIVLFCGSLYGIALGGLKWLGPVTPIGGLAFMAGWSVFAWHIWVGSGPLEK
jgi:uncharacterized membrane protein YgdD (TMEM256/DUF423 family)